MREAYRRTRKDAAAGVDGVTAAQYEADLEANLSGLLERFKSGRYRAPAVRRVHLEKPGHEQDPPDWHSDAGGQNPSTRGADGDGAGVRAGVSGMLVTGSGRGVVHTRRWMRYGKG